MSSSAGICLAAAVAGALCACGAEAQEAGAQSVTRVAARRLEPVAYDVTLPDKVGVLEAREHLVLSFEAPGRLESVAEEGARVAAGAVVAQLDATLERARLRQAVLQLREARSELARVRGLKRSEAASEKVLEAAETALGLRAAERDAARAQLERRTLLAPVAGLLSETFVEPGEFVAAGTPVATLLDTSALRLEVGLPGYQVGRVEPGARAVVRAPAFPGERFEGVVTRVAGAAAEGRHLFDVEIRLPADERLRPGMSARAAIVTQHLERALVVPVEVVVERGGERVVFFGDGGRARRVPVGGATLHGDRLLLPAEIPHRTLVVRGQHDLRDGAPVRVDNAVLDGAAR